MKKLISFLFLWAILLIDARAESLYLTCVKMDGERFSGEGAYITPPLFVSDQFLSDSVAMGISSYFSPPPTTWEIDLSRKTMSSPEQYEIFSISKADGSAIEAEGTNGRAFLVNRISGELKSTVTVGETVRKEWTAAHGGVLPSSWTYRYSCEGRSKPRI